MCQIRYFMCSSSGLNFCLPMSSADNLSGFANSLAPDQACQGVGLHLDPNCVTY